MGSHLELPCSAAHLVAAPQAWVCLSQEQQSFVHESSRVLTLPVHDLYPTPKQKSMVHAVIRSRLFGGSLLCWNQRAKTAWAEPCAMP